MIITLHACDTATDYALYNAIRHNVKYIFSVPCCQHELNATINTDNELKIMLKHGLIKERFSSLLTDAIRCEILENSGYDVDVIEFVDFSNSPKNLLIRAVKSVNSTKTIDDIELIMNKLSVNHKLYNLLYKDKK